MIPYISSFKILSSSIISGLLTVLIQKNYITNNIIFNIIFLSTIYIILNLIIFPLIGALNHIDIINIENLIKDIPLFNPIFQILINFEKIIIKLKKSNTYNH